MRDCFKSLDSEISIKADNFDLLNVPPGQEQISILNLIIH